MLPLHSTRATSFFHSSIHAILTLPFPHPCYLFRLCCFFNCRFTFSCSCFIFFLLSGFTFFGFFIFFHDSLSYYYVLSFYFLLIFYFFFFINYIFLFFYIFIIISFNILFYLT